LVVVVAIVAILLVAILVRILQSPTALDSIGSAATDIVRPIVIPLVDLINQPAFVYVASTVIVISALMILAAYEFRVVAPQLQALRRVRHQVEALPGGGALDWHAGLARVEDVLRRNGILLSSWATYVQDAKDRGRLPSRRFSLYARDDDFSASRGRGGLLSALPGYYTTIGLILTFVGLVVALYFAAKGFRSGDLAEARLAIIQLLNASAFKFLSSVAALFSALLISIVHRLMTSRLRRTAQATLDVIDVHLQGLRSDGPTDIGPSQGERILADKLDAVIAELAALRLGSAR
jgi:hypothetical protein